ncbi:MAG TPA: redoxin domain-containing protein [Sphingobacterium sp.]|nr:redoxin domain-containing protein [Sphingobacterium sp.]
MKKNRALFGLLFLLSFCYGQEGSLKVGDFLPELEFHNVLNIDSGPVNLRNGKALVLDFGSTTCAPCIASLKKFQVLLEDFEDDIQVISVTRDKKERVSKFLEANRLGDHSTIPILYEDSVLKRLFPHLTEPHLVWLGKDGKVKAITNHDYVTKKHVDLFLTDEILDWPVKWDFPLDVKKPLRVWNNEILSSGLVPKVEQSIYISSHIPGVRSKYMLTSDSIRKSIRVLVINDPIPELYLRTLGYSLYSGFMGSQIVTENFEGRDLVYNHLHGPKLEWMQENTFSYEMYFPDNLSTEERNRRIRILLDQYFPYAVELVDTVRDVWVISPTANAVEVADSTEEPGIMMKEMITWINGVPNAAPTFYVAGPEEPKRHFKMNIDTSRLDDFDYLEQELNRYGYRLSKEKRTIETLVIRKE